jgi:hypothetical protein
MPRTTPTRKDVDDVQGDDVLGDGNIRSISRRRAVQDVRGEANNFEGFVELTYGPCAISFRFVCPAPSRVLQSTLLGLSHLLLLTLKRHDNRLSTEESRQPPHFSPNLDGRKSRTTCVYLGTAMPS